MAKTYRSTLEVRGYELDSFGHVNHAVYVSYLEHARWQMLAEKGITLEKLGEWKRWPVIARIELEYLKPSYLGDQLEVRTSVAGYGKTHFTIEHEVLRGDTQVAKGKVTVVIVNENGRPAEMTPEIRGLWLDAEDPAGSAD